MNIDSFPLKKLLKNGIKTFSFRIASIEENLRTMKERRKRALEVEGGIKAEALLKSPVMKVSKARADQSIAEAAAAATAVRTVVNALS